MKNLIIITVSILLDESYFKFTSLGHFGLVTILLILFRTSSGVAVSEKRRNTSPEFHEIRLKMSKIPMLISQKLHNSHGTAGLRVAFSQRQLLLAPYVPGLEAAPSRPGAIKELPGLVRQRRMHHTHHQDPTVLPGQKTIGKWMENDGKPAIPWGFLWDLKLIYGIAKLGNMGNQVGGHITPITN